MSGATMTRSPTLKAVSLLMLTGCCSLSGGGRAVSPGPCPCPLGLGHRPRSHGSDLDGGANLRLVRRGGRRVAAVRDVPGAVAAQPADRRGVGEDDVGGRV